MEDKKQTRRNLILFPLGTVGRDMVYSLVTNFLHALADGGAAFGHHGDHGRRADL